MFSEDTVQAVDIIGGCSRTRTYDPLIKSQLLYQLSYAPHQALAARNIRARAPKSKRSFTVRGDSLGNFRGEQVQAIRSSADNSRRPELPVTGKTGTGPGGPLR
jgi:hypothetical protein